MRLTFAVFALCLVAGCMSPPKPKECEGEFRPVNGTGQKAASLSAAQSLALCKKGGQHVQQG